MNKMLLIIKKSIKQFPSKICNKVCKAQKDLQKDLFDKIKNDHK